MYRHLAPAKLEMLRRQLIAKGYPVYWPELSDLVREEANFTCCICGRRSTSDTVTDHKDGKPWNCNWDNLRVVCRGYNTGGSCSPGKPFKCLGCGQPIRHRGYCLACNAERKEASQ